MILLHTTKYGDSSLILHGYTREVGRQSFMLRGAYGKSLGYLHPLSILDIQTSETAKGNKNPAAGKIVYLKEFSPRYNLSSLRSNIYKNSMVMYISELLYKSLVETDSDAPLYDFIEKAIVELNGAEGNFANFHLWFTIQYACLLGFRPGKEFSAEFNPFSEQESLLLEKIISGKEAQKALQIPLRGEQRTDFLNSLLKYLSYHLGSGLDIKSLAVLHRVLV